MDLSRGTCILCGNNTKIVVPPQAEEITSLLCDILRPYIEIQKFDEISSTLKVCTLCLHDILQVAEHTIQAKQFFEQIDHCSLCNRDEHLILVVDWVHFDTLLENIQTRRIRKCSFCLTCIKYLELFGRIKQNFLRKYPHLALTHNDLSKKDPTSRNYKSSPKKKSTPKCEDRVKKSRKITQNIEDYLKHLKPLKNSKFNLESYQDNIKLLKQVCFVSLSNLDLSTNRRKNETKGGHRGNSSSSSENDCSPESTSKHSFFKIKLKPISNKSKKKQPNTGKITKLKSKPDLFSSVKKLLIVRLLKADLEQLQHSIENESDDNMSSFQTPTKASKKLLSDISSSSKKRKSVTFAEDLNVEIVDGESSKFNNIDGSPLKSLLKKDNFENGFAGFRNSDNKIDDISKSYFKEIQENNDNIFEVLKNEPVSTKKRRVREVTEGEQEPDKDINGASNADKEKIDDISEVVSSQNERISEPDSNITSCGSSTSLTSDFSEDYMVTLEEYKKNRRSTEEVESRDKLLTLDEVLDNEVANLVKKYNTTLEGTQNGDELEQGASVDQEERKESQSSQSKNTDEMECPVPEEAVENGGMQTSDVSSAKPRRDSVSPVKSNSSSLESTIDSSSEKLSEEMND